MTDTNNSPGAVSFGTAMMELSPDLSTSGVATDVETPYHPTQLFGSVDANQRRINDDVNIQNTNRSHPNHQRQRNLRVVLNMEDVVAERVEGGDTNSVVSADEARDLDDSAIEACRQRLMLMLKPGEDPEANVADDEQNGILVDLSGEIKIPQPKEGWTQPKNKAHMFEPPFEFVDNPGEWHGFSYKAKFASEKTKVYKKGEYLWHSLPTGCRPVPVDAANDNKRIVDGWEFHYKGWRHDADLTDNPYRSGAKQLNLFPNNRKGYLDYALLKKMGLSQRRILDNDCLFFFQLLFPICDPAKSGIENDPRKAFYSEVENFTNQYAAEIGLMGSYGHSFKPVNAEELLRFDMALIKDGARGGCGGATYRRWNPTMKDDFDEDIAGALTYHRFNQIRRTYKLNNNSKAKKKGEDGYEPAIKYDMIFDVQIFNVNQMTQEADLDLCGDETTWAHMGFGESGTGLLGRILNKPGVTKGGQTVIVCDVHRNRPRAFLHRHKCHAQYPDFGGDSGPQEVRRLLSTKVQPLVRPPPPIFADDAPSTTETNANESTSTGRKIFKEKPHTTWDNYFSGDDIMNWCGKNEWPCTMTCQRGRLPKKVPTGYWHKASTPAKDLAAKVARYFHPVTAVKSFVGKDDNGVERAYQRVHVSFQSTSSTNISTVNALNENYNYVRKRERGQGTQKRKWGIEMNGARQLYLATYGRVDTLDAMVKKCNIGYTSWKYWHSAKNHALAIGVVVAYDMYCEVLQEAYSQWGLTEEVASSTLLDFHSFRMRLSTQGLLYDPKDCMYPGDKHMRANTQMSKKRRSKQPIVTRTPKRNATSAAATALVTPQEIKDETKNISTRLCGDLTKLCRHLDSLQGTNQGYKHGGDCAYCGEKSFTRCGLCGVALHHRPKNGLHIGKDCFMHYHNTLHFGMAYDDRHKRGMTRNNWCQPSKHEVDRNKKAIKVLEKTSTRKKKNDAMPNQLNVATTSTNNTTANNSNYELRTRR